MRSLLKKIVRKLKVVEVPFEFEPLEKPNITPEEKKSIQNLSLLNFLNLTKTFRIEVDKSVRKSLDLFFLKKFLNRQKDATPQIYLVGEPGKKMKFQFLTEEQAKFIRNAGMATVAIEIFKGKTFHMRYLNTISKKLREEIRKLPIEIQKRLDLDENPFRRDILQKDIKKLTKEDVEYIKAVKRAIEETSKNFVKELSLFSRLVSNQLKKGNIPHELREIEGTISQDGKIGEELLKHSDATLKVIYEATNPRRRERERENLKEKLLNIGNKKTQKFLFGPSL